MDNPLEIYLGGDLSFPAKTKATNWIAIQLKRYAADDLGHLPAIEKDTGRLIGAGGLLKRVLDSKEALEIAYSIIPQYWGNGYATEISQQLKKYALENKMTKTLISIIHVENEPSKKVAIKNCMKPDKATVYRGMEVKSLSGMPEAMKLAS